MDQSNSATLGHFNGPQHYSFGDDASTTDLLHSDLFADIGSLHDINGAALASNPPRRAIDDGSHPYLQSAYTSSAPFVPQIPASQARSAQRQIDAQQRQAQFHALQYGMRFPAAAYPSSHAGNLATASQQGNLITQHTSGGLRPVQDTSNSLASSVPLSRQAPPAVTQRARRAPYPQAPEQAQFSPAARSGHQPYIGVSPPVNNVAASARRLEPATPESSRQAIANASQRNSLRKGGRQRGAHLSEGIRDKSHRMRKAGACWGCALQRDTVSASPNTIG